MPWARPETSGGQHGMPRTLRARPGPSHTSPRTNSVRSPMRSGPHVLPHPKARARPQGDSSASGSVTSCRRPFASSCLTTSGCGTTSAGQRLTAERARGSAPANVRICRRSGEVATHAETIRICGSRAEVPEPEFELEHEVAADGTAGCASAADRLGCLSRRGQGWPG